jgi:hypothetical protein
MRRHPVPAGVLIEVNAWTHAFVEGVDIHSPGRFYVLRERRGDERSNNYGDD